MARKPYYIGGLMRCCTDTLREHDDSKDKEGAKLKCKWCPSEIILMNGKWQWDNPPYQGA